MRSRLIGLALVGSGVEVCLENEGGALAVRPLQDMTAYRRPVEEVPDGILRHHIVWATN